MRRVAVIVGSRADYGLVRWICQDVQESPHLSLQLILSGSLNDLSSNQAQEISEDGLLVSAVAGIPVPLEGEADGVWLGQVLSRAYESLLALQPDVVLLTGDRIETLAAAQAAVLLGVPIAHLHGGELSVGSVDDSIRHAITKLSSRHFATAPQYARRIMQMGESADSVFVVGNPGTSPLIRGSLPSREEVERAFSVNLSDPYFVVTYHPVTAIRQESIQGAQAMFKALVNQDRYHVVVTGVNVDPGAAELRKLVVQHAKQFPKKITLVDSFGHDAYLTVLSNSMACVGNSSSGIIEAPAAGVPTVNIGTRQEGRLRGPSIIDVSSRTEEISRALESVTTEAFQNTSQGLKVAGRDQDPSRLVADLLGEEWTKGGPAKVFRDCSAGCSSWQMVSNDVA